MTEILAEVMKRLDVWSVIGGNEEVEGYNTVFGKSEYANGVIITQLSCSMLGNLANACGGSDEQFILSMLCGGKPVLVKEEGMEHRIKRRTMPKPLISLYTEYEKKLYLFGIKPLAHSGIFLKKRLITASDLAGISVLETDKSCIISPLAQDYIKENKIVVVKRE